MTENADRFEKIVVLDNKVEAGLLDSVLSERGIPHEMVSYYDSAYSGLFQAGKGWGHVEAPSGFKEEIVRVHKSIRQAPTSPPSEPDNLAT